MEIKSDSWEALDVGAVSLYLKVIFANHGADMDFIITQHFWGFYK